MTKFFKQKSIHDTQNVHKCYVSRLLHNYVIPFASTKKFYAQVSTFVECHLELVTKLKKSRLHSSNAYQGQMIMRWFVWSWSYKITRNTVTVWALFCTCYTNIIWRTWERRIGSSKRSFAPLTHSYVACNKLQIEWVRIHRLTCYWKSRRWM